MASSEKQLNRTWIFNVFEGLPLANPPDSSLAIHHGLASRSARLNPQSKLTDPFSQSLLHSHQMHALSERWVPWLQNEFDRAEIPVLFLKGWSLAKRIYSHPTDRSFFDFDLLVQPDDLNKSSGLLSKLRFRPTSVGPKIRANSYKSEFEWQDHPLVKVELHSQLGYGRFEISRIWARTLRNPDLGILTLDPMDEALYLLFHMGVQHRFQKLIWLLDWDLFLKKNPLDPQVLANRAKELGLLPSLKMAQDFLKVLRQEISEEGSPWFDSVLSGRIEGSRRKAIQLRAALMGGWLPTMSYAFEQAIALGFEHAAKFHQPKSPVKNKD